MPPVMLSIRPLIEAQQRRPNRIADMDVVSPKLAIDPITMLVDHRQVRRPSSGKVSHARQEVCDVDG
jgi:hypothetical protein